MELGPEVYFTEGHLVALECRHRPGLFLGGMAADAQFLNQEMQCSMELH